MKHLLLPLLALLLGACKPPEIVAYQAKSYPYTITTTVGMITDITKNIVGDESLATVSGLIGEGIDPHLYKPTRDDLLALQNADLVFYNGLHLEGKMTDTLEKLAAKKPVHAITETITKDQLLHDEEEGGHDPHLWMDASLWSQATSVITEALTKFDPDNTATYQANSEAYQAQLAQLHTYAQESLATIPESQRVLVTAHDAFGYLGQAYGLEVRGIQGLSTESEAGVKDIEDLITFIIERKIPAIFVETSVSDKNVRALIEGCAAKGHTLTIGGELFSDAMGQPGSYEGTYLGMIDHNVTTITNALGGTAAGFKK
ncbi:MAG: zinc ABC transporter substrate-binding protein [Verrucomicrobiota bacterium]